MTQNYSYHIRGDRSPLKCHFEIRWSRHFESRRAQHPIHTRLKKATDYCRQNNKMLKKSVYWIIGSWVLIQNNYLTSSHWHFSFRWSRQCWRNCLCQLNEKYGYILGTYKINWARRTTWGWWDEWDAMHTQDSKFEPWLSEAELATSRSRRVSLIVDFFEWAGKKLFETLNARAGFEPAITDFPSRQL